MCAFVIDIISRWMFTCSIFTRNYREFVFYVLFISILYKLNRLVPTIFFFHKQGLCVRIKTLMDPKLRPIRNAKIITKPFMSHFMKQNKIISKFCFFIIITICINGLVFHSPIRCMYKTKLLIYPWILPKMICIKV